MTAIGGAPDNALPFIPARLSFSFWDAPEIHVQAPWAYEQWRLSETVQVVPGWFYHQPTIEFIQADSAEAAVEKVDWTRVIDRTWHERNWLAAREYYLETRPWWAAL